MQNNLMLSDQFHMLMNGVTALLGSDVVSAERSNKAAAAMIDFGNLDAYQERNENFRLSVCSMLQLPDDASDTLIFQVLLNRLLVPRILVINGGRHVA